MCVCACVLERESPLSSGVISMSQIEDEELKQVITVRVFCVCMCVAIYMVGRMSEGHA